MEKQATYRVIHFPKTDRYVGLAHNYEQAVLISTRDHATYTEAREDLERTCTSCGVTLRWFEGEFTYAREAIVPK